jgi:hypothetical protein
MMKRVPSWRPFFVCAVLIFLKKVAASLRGVARGGRIVLTIQREIWLIFVRCIINMRGEIN